MPPCGSGETIGSNNVRLASVIRWFSLGIGGLDDRGSPQTLAGLPRQLATHSQLATRAPFALARPHLPTRPLAHSPTRPLAHSPTHPTDLPTSSSGAWRGISSMLPAAVTDKVTISSSSKLPQALLTFIDPSELPIEYARRCKGCSKELMPDPDEVEEKCLKLGMVTVHHHTRLASY